MPAKPTKLVKVTKGQTDADGRPAREIMNGKPVFEMPAQSIVNFESGFGHKLLCDSLTFSTGVACAYSCTFCYVPSQMHKLLFEDLAAVGLAHEQLVIRRTNAVEALRVQLEAAKRGKGWKARLFVPQERKLVIYSSASVDVAANTELCGETVAACLAVLELTPWHIRLLSKSNLLPRIAQAIPEEYRHRMIYGVSTGTLDDPLARCFEQGTPTPSKRLESLYWLQDNGYRTFGMLCPSLPQRDYPRFGDEMSAAVRPEKCEEVWAEVLNVRGKSMVNTVNALRAGGYEWEASELAKVGTDPVQWEDYARKTFLAHHPHYRFGQLRYLQYVNPLNRAWWIPQQARGAVLLGKAHAGKVSATTEAVVAG